MPDSGLTSLLEVGRRSSSPANGANGSWEANGFPDGHLNGEPSGRLVGRDESVSRSDAPPPHTRTSGAAGRTAEAAKVLSSPLPPLPRPLRTFIGSFNVNGSALPAVDAAAWLAEAADADVVALGFQECGQLPARPFPPAIDAAAAAVAAAAARGSPPLTRRPSVEGVDESDHDCQRAGGGDSHGENGTGSTGSNDSGGGGFGKGGARAHGCGSNSPAARAAAAAAAAPLAEAAAAAAAAAARTAAGTDTAATAALPTAETDAAYLRGARDAVTDARDLLDPIRSCLGPGMELVADVAMGEPATDGKVTVGGQTTEWYGAIRLLVFVRAGRVDPTGVAAFVVPAGSKPTALLAPPLLAEYPRDRAPDKGGVAVFVPSQRLLLVNVHLCGTNKYGVPEAVFDAERVEQLEAIHAALACCLPVHPDACRQVLLGDLNFRVEMHAAAEDKAKGGRDFRAVLAAVQRGVGGTSASSNPAAVSDGDSGTYGPDSALEAAPATAAAAATTTAVALLALYCEADRLAALLSKSKSRWEASGSGEKEQQQQQQQQQEQQQQQQQEQQQQQQQEQQQQQQEDHHCPPLLRGSVDALGCALRCGVRVAPTFTYKPGAAQPRAYSEKRTPSWTDRILLRGFNADPAADGDRVSLASVAPTAAVRGAAALLPAPPAGLRFAALRQIVISDHEPVFAHFSSSFLDPDVAVAGADGDGDNDDSDSDGGALKVGNGGNGKFPAAAASGGVKCPACTGERGGNAASATLSRGGDGSPSSGGIPASVTAVTAVTPGLGGLEKPGDEGEKLLLTFPPSDCSGESAASDEAGFFAAASAGASVGARKKETAAAAEAGGDGADGGCGFVDGGDGLLDGKGSRRRGCCCCPLGGSAAAAGSRRGHFPQDSGPQPL